MAFQPTDQQQAILRQVTNPNGGNIAIVARAGCGKTSTILLCVSAIREYEPFSEVAVVAYNKAIADEVGHKLKEAGHGDWRLTQASTAHALGFGLLKYAYKSNVDDRKVMKIIDAKAVAGNLDCLGFRTQIAQLVRFAKQAAIGFFGAIDDTALWQDLADHYGLELEETTDAQRVIAAAKSVYTISLADTDTVDFDDMVLLPLVKQMRVRFQKDWVFIDEAQDLSPARQALIRKFVKRDGRVVIVGDDRQAIYGFSGADANALTNMVQSYGATVLPLSVTWRCPAAVVREAQVLVPDIEAAPSASEGAVRHISLQEFDWASLQPGQDAILCRNTAPLVSAAFKLIRMGIPARVEGRQIGEGLRQLAVRWKVSTINQLLNRLGQYRQREAEKAIAKDRPDRVEEIEDRVQTLVEIAQACQLKGLQAVDDVLGAIDALFGDDVADAVTLATYHRGKGREWPNVYLYEPWRCPSKAARQPWQMGQEANLNYVAITRACETLTYLG